MANKNLFRSLRGKLAPKADAVNEAGGLAYQMEPRHALAQLAATGCLNATFYATAEQQLDGVLALALDVDPLFVAKTAVFARQKGAMKDLPALLLAVLAVRDLRLLRAAFPLVVDSAKMLRNFVQIVRSGVVGRKSLGTVPKTLVRDWLAARGDDELFRGAVGADPSLADVVRMVHPKPATAARAALYAYLIGRRHDDAALPELVQSFERFKQSPTEVEVPDVPHQMLTALPLDVDGWTAIARHASWQTTRMNLSTFARHGVFEVEGMTELVAARLRMRTLVRRSRVMPYQLLVAYRTAASQVPLAVREALQDAMEHAIANVPAIDGKVVVCPDISGSMQSPVTGVRKGATTAVRCIDVAALVAAALLRRNPDATVLPFESKVCEVTMNPRDSVMTNAEKLASLPSGGTNCSAPLRWLNHRGAKADLVVMVSDNESWVDSPVHGRFGGSPTATMKEWEALRARCPQAKLVCIDIQPYVTTQGKERPDIWNVGGFSDQVFDLLGEVAAGATEPGAWVRRIEAVELAA